MAPKEIPLPAESVLAMATSQMVDPYVPKVKVERNLHDKYGKFMTIVDVTEALDLKGKQAIDAKRQGLLGPRADNPAGGVHSYYFLTDNIEAFRDADYRALYPVRRAYTKHGNNFGRHKASEVKGDPAQDWVEAKDVNQVAHDAVGASIERVKNGTTLTMVQLIGAVTVAIVPKIQAEVLKALKEFYGGLTQ